MVRKMLIANDGSAGGERALACALDLAKRLSVRLDMICVEELPQFPVSIDEVEEAQADQGGAFAKVVAAAEKAAAGLGVPFAAYVVPGRPVKSIVEFVQRGGYDLLVVGFMGHSALYNRVIGGAADRLVEIAPCKVMVVK